MQVSEMFDDMDAAVLINHAENCLSRREFASAQGAYDEALAQFHRSGRDDSAVVRALVGLGWTLQGLDDCHGALRAHEQALNAQMRLASGDDAALCTIRRGIASTLTALGRLEQAQQVYHTVLGLQRGLLDERSPELVETLNIVGETAARLQRYDEACRYQQEALAILRALHPDGAPEIAAALTNLGVSLYRLDLQQEAEACLREALAIDPDLLLAAENLIHVLYQQERKAEARILAAEKYRRQSFVVQPPPPRPAGTLLVLWSLDGNIPKHHLLARLPMTVVDWHIQYASDAHEQLLPAYDLVFNLIGDADQGAAALSSAARFQGRCTKKILNDPLKVQRTRRHMMPDLLAGIDDLVIPRVAHLAGIDLHGAGRARLLTEAGIEPPLLLRSAGMHGGQTVQLISTWDALAETCMTFSDDEAVYATAYHEYASLDGLYRKYRAIFVDRTPYPYHLAISPDWLVHYFSADMEAHPWKLDEELAYLDDAASVIGKRAFGVLAAVARRMDLDYCGIDFSLLPDGRVLLFEANATMLIHPEDETGALARKNPYVARVFGAFDELVRRSLPADKRWKTGDAG